MYETTIKTTHTYLLNYTLRFRDCDLLLILLMLPFVSLKMNTVHEYDMHDVVSHTDTIVGTSVSLDGTY